MQTTGEASYLEGIAARTIVNVRREGSGVTCTRIDRNPDVRAIVSTTQEIPGASRGRPERIGIRLHLCGAAAVGGDHILEAIAHPIITQEVFVGAVGRAALGHELLDLRGVLGGQLDPGANGHPCTSAHTQGSIICDVQILRVG